MARILVTDGEQRSALAAVRSLGRAGHQLFVTSSRARSIAGASRFVRMHATTPDPMVNADDYTATIRDLVAAWQIDVLLPVTEASLLAILARRHQFGDVVIPFPDYGVFNRVSDKEAVLEHARALGLGVPIQQVLPDPETRPEVHLPIVAKPSRSVVGANGRRSKTAATYVADERELADLLRDSPASAYPILLQQRIVGPGIGVFVLMWKGELLAHFGHRRLREKPPWGGVSVLRESAEVNAELLKASVNLLHAFGWSGVAMVEYKIDAATGQACVMEINGRLWGSLQLAIDAGVDFPRLLVDAALGEPTRPVASYRTGVRSRWWWGDVDHLLARLRHSKEALGLPENAPSRSRAILDFLSAFGPANRNEVLRWSDPGPALVESLDWFRGR